MVQAQGKACVHQAEGQEGSKAWKPVVAQALVGKGRVH